MDSDTELGWAVPFMGAVLTLLILAGLVLGALAGCTGDGAPAVTDDGFDGTVLSVAGQTALLEMDAADLGRIQALNPYPSLRSGDRVLVQERAMSSDENRILGCDNEERASCPSDETPGGPR